MRILEKEIHAKKLEFRQKGNDVNIELIILNILQSKIMKNVAYIISRTRLDFSSVPFSRCNDPSSVLIYNDPNSDGEGERARERDRIER